jgi:hypothetical protein
MMDATLTTLAATVLASALLIGALAYWQGRADERRARRLRGIRQARGPLAGKARNEGRARL